MAKNHEKFVYLDVAVPRTNTLLLQYLQEVHDSSNTPESQLLVQLATERVKQIVAGDGQPAQLAVLASMLSSAMPQLATQNVPTSTNGAAPRRSSPGAVQTLDYDLMEHGANDGDMDAYGDPD